MPKALLAIVLICGLAAPAAAQEAGTIQGTVVEAGSQRPLSGVQVSVPGSGRGALTNASGEYLLVGVPVGSQTVRAQLIGFTEAEQTAEVTAGQVVRVDFSLSQSAIAMDEVVVTGTAGATSKREIGTAIATVDAAEITEVATINTVTDLFQGRAPGLTYVNNGGTVGTGGSIRIRGAGSLGTDNAPVVYVDGVRVYAGNAGNFSNMWCMSCVNALGGQNSIVLDQLNPEDIQSVEVIKGPAAATLYGADAANGVIQIITKKGRTGQQELQWNARVETGQTDWTVDPIRNYTTCTEYRKQALYDEEDPSLGLLYPGCEDVPAGTILDYAGFEQNPNGLRSGAVRNVSLSVRGGGEQYSFYVAGNRDYEEGVFLNNMMERTSGRANFVFYPMDQLDFSVNLSYTDSRTRYPTNDNSGQGLIISAANWLPGYNYDAVFEDEDWESRRGFAWLAPEDSYEFDNQLFSERLILGSTVNYRPFSWFRNRLTVGLDRNARLARAYGQPGSAMTSIGFVYRREPKNMIYTADYAGTISTSLSEAFTSDLSFGAQYILDQYEVTSAYGTGLGSPLNQLVSDAATTSGSDGYREQASLGFYLQEQVGWKDRLFLTGAVRLDNNSVFGDEINRVFYPKAMASYIISEEPFFRIPGVDQLKLRAAYGQAGNAPGPFDAARSYAASVATLGDGSSVPAVALSAYGNPDLKPEKGEEFELGFDASFLNNRAGIEFTYYNQNTRDALLYVPVPPSNGFGGSRLENLGEINNQGFEVSLTGTPVQSRPVTWESRLSLYTNDNELVTFGYERTPILLGFYNSPQRHAEGYPIGGFWASKLQQNADGSYVRDEAGNLVLEEEASYIGSPTPTREVSFANTFTIFGDLQLYALLDYKGGHYQYNYKDLSRCRSYVDDVTGEFQPGECWLVNDPGATPLEREIYGSMGTSTYDRMYYFIQKADFVKLRDVSLTYSLPAAWTRRVGADRASITVAGHDLAVWAPDYTGPDPEVNYYGDEEFLSVDAWTAPMVRRFTASLSVAF